MTASELIAELRLMGPQDPNVIFQYLADHVYEAELPTSLNGPPRRVRDASDFREWLLELAEAAKPARCVSPALRQTQIPAQQPRDHRCPDCGHVHEGRDECGKYLGEEKFCPCESRVTA